MHLIIAPWIQKVPQCGSEVADLNSQWISQRGKQNDKKQFSSQLNDFESQVSKFFDHKNYLPYSTKKLTVKSENGQVIGQIKLSFKRGLFVRTYLYHGHLCI